MIIGDPYKFSIIVDSIDEWNVNESTWYNGVLLLCVDGELFPKQISTSTLNCEITPLRDSLEHITVNKEIYTLGKVAAFKQMYDITYPNIDVNNDYSYEISPASLVDVGCFVFAVGNGDRVRILAAMLKYITTESKHNLDNLDIREALITTEELHKMVLKLENSE